MKLKLAVIIVIIIIIAAAGSVTTALRRKSAAPDTAAASATSAAEAVSSSTVPEAVDFENFSYAYFDDTFELADGGAIIQGYASGTPAAWNDSEGAHTEIKGPVSYSFGTSSSGMITAEGAEGDAVILYRGSGANLMHLILFAFVDENGVPTEKAYATLMDDDAKIESLSVQNGVITANLLVISAADKKNLPHYEQKPTEPETLRFALQGDQLAELE